MLGPQIDCPRKFFLGFFEIPSLEVQSPQVVMAIGIKSSLPERHLIAELCRFELVQIGFNDSEVHPASRKFGLNFESAFQKLFCFHIFSDL
jgi:hypothetical protein